MKKIGYFLILFSLTVNAQYPFEKHKALKYKNFSDWNSTSTEKAENHTLLIPNFFKKGNNLTVELSSDSNTSHNSEVKIFNNKKLVKKFSEEIYFSPAAIDTLKIADINGDGLKDIKLTTSFMGCGIGGLYVNVIYLFQKKDHTFTKISFSEMLGNNEDERDLDNDGNFEIITMYLKQYKEHSYWLFNLYNFDKNKLVNVNKKFNYPIMVQYLLRDNFEITKKISSTKMKFFNMNFPEDYSKK